MSIQLIYLPLDDPKCHQFRQEAESVLNEEEMERYLRCVESVQVQYAFARLIVKTELAQLLSIPAKNIEFKFNENGKPYLEGGEAYFSISHCKTAIVVVISHQPVGVDVEQVFRDRSPKLASPWENASVFLNPAMAEQVTNAGSDDQKAYLFTRLWTCMESYVKLHGSSVFSIKDTFELACSASSYKGLTPLTETVYFASWQFAENEIISIASESKSRVLCRRWRGDLIDVQPFAVSE